MQRKYKGAQRIAIIRAEIEEAIEEIKKLPVQVGVHPYKRTGHPASWIPVYRLACINGAFTLADRVKSALYDKFGKQDVDWALEYAAWQRR